MNKKNRFLQKLVGKTIRKIENDEGQMRFHFDDILILMDHTYSCCESVYIESIDGDLEDLIGSPLTMFEEATKTSFDCDENSKDYIKSADSFTWTFYKLATVKGYVTLRWLGVSNGCYSEEVEIHYKIEQENVKPFWKGMENMKDAVMLTINENPQAQSRHRSRIARKGNKAFIHNYNTKKSGDYRKVIIEEYKNCYPNYMLSEDKSEQLKLYLTIYKKTPSNFTKKQKELVEKDLLRPTTKPDFDNYAKIVCDALNGIAYIDDSQIVEAIVVKKYDLHNPHSTIILEKRKENE